MIIYFDVSPPWFHVVADISRCSINPTFEVQVSWSFIFRLKILDSINENSYHPHIDIMNYIMSKPLIIEISSHQIST